MVYLTAVFMVVEIVAGLIFGSMALLADGVHMATHVGALGLAAWAYWMARRHAKNRDFTFGSGKSGDLAGFASALILGVIAIGVGVGIGDAPLSARSDQYRRSHDRRGDSVSA